MSGRISSKWMIFAGTIRLTRVQDDTLSPTKKSYLYFRTARTSYQALIGFLSPRHTHLHERHPQERRRRPSRLLGRSGLPRHPNLQQTYCQKGGGTIARAQLALTGCPFVSNLLVCFFRVPKTSNICYTYALMSMVMYWLKLLCITEICSSYPTVNAVTCRTYINCCSGPTSSASSTNIDHGH